MYRMEDFYLQNSYFSDTKKNADFAKDSVGPNNSMY